MKPCGTSLLETLVVVAIAALVAAAGLPALAEFGSGARTAAAARELAATFQALRWRAVTQGRSHGLLFERDGTGWLWHEVADGNGNGLRRAEIVHGTDPRISGPRRLEERVAGVTFGFPAGGPFPGVPPGGGSIDPFDDPIRAGSLDLVSFTPLGTSSSGTFFVSDSRRTLQAVVLYGRTVRIRVWRYDARSRRWAL